MFRGCNSQKPRVYRTKTAHSLNFQYKEVPPYFPATHPNTVWLINRMRAGHAAPVVNILKSRESMNTFFKTCYFQILDKPSAYDPSNHLDRPMFSEKAYLFLNVFAVAVYFRCETIVRTLAPIRVSLPESSSTYRSLGQVNIDLYAAYVHDHSLGDLLQFQLPVLMMRREAYFAVSQMFEHGDWHPSTSFSVGYYRRNYQSVCSYGDWLDYAWALLEERPNTKISHLLSAMSAAASKHFYIGVKVEFQPIGCYMYGHGVSGKPKRSVIIYRSVARRALCKLFLNPEPLRVMPQVIPFIRVFQRERFFVSQTAKAMDPEFRKTILSSLASRLLNITPAMNTSTVSTAAFQREDSHKLSIYDFDNIVALLLHFLVVAADRHVASLRDSLIRLLMDILVDMELVFCFAIEPAIHISYYLSLLVDGPFIQPNDLQLMLKNIPVLLMYQTNPHRLFPHTLTISESREKFGEEEEKIYRRLLDTLPEMWKSKCKQAIQLLMKYRVDIDESMGVKSVRHAFWKNKSLMNRIRENLKSINGPQDVQDSPDTCFYVESSGGLPAGWAAKPKEYFNDALSLLLEEATDTVFGAPKRLKNKWDYLLPEMLADPYEANEEAPAGSES